MKVIKPSPPPRGIVKIQLPAQPGIDPREAYIAYMFAACVRAPGAPTRNELIRGAVTELGEIGAITEKS